MDDVKTTRLTSFWRKLKIWRRVPLGPVVLEFSFSRKTDLRNTRRLHFFKKEILPIDVTNKKSIEHNDKEAKDISINSNSTTANETRKDLAVIFGVGSGFGYALARRVARESLRVVLVSRNVEKLRFLLDEIREAGGNATAYACDVTSELSVKKTFSKIVKYHGAPSLVVYGIQSSCLVETTNVEVPAFEAGWKHNCFGAFLVSKEAANVMVPVARGTIILIGSTSSLIGRERHLSLVVGRFGQRGLAQVLSRELWPKGIHICHMMIDADIKGENVLDEKFPQSNPDDIVDSVMFLHNQPKTAWTSELDIRPWNEKFWEHC